MTMDLPTPPADVPPADHAAQRPPQEGRRRGVVGYPNATVERQDRALSRLRLHPGLGRGGTVYLIERNENNYDAFLNYSGRWVNISEIIAAVLRVRRRASARGAFHPGARFPLRVVGIVPLLSAHLGALIFHDEASVSVVVL